MSFTNRLHAYLICLQVVLTACLQNLGVSASSTGRRFALLSDRKPYRSRTEEIPMPGELIPRNVSVAVSGKTGKRLAVVVNETRLQHAVSRAISSAGQAAMFDVAELKRVQRELENMNPDAADALNL